MFACFLTNLSWYWETDFYSSFFFSCDLMETLVFQGSYCLFSWKKQGNGECHLVTQCNVNPCWICHWNTWVREAVMLNKLLEEFPLASKKLAYVLQLKCFHKLNFCGLLCQNNPSYLGITGTIGVDVFSLLTDASTDIAAWDASDCSVISPSPCEEDKGFLLTLLCENGFCFFRVIWVIFTDNCQTMARYPL